MSPSGSEKVAKALFDAASTFLQMGFSVIPVHGDCRPAQAKVAAVDWKAYQSRFATMPELKAWFFEQGAEGMALVTGKISRLLVFDFDDERLAEVFLHRFAHLCETRIVYSANRELPHVYFRLPVGVTIPSRRLQGMDVQSDGRYIITPPTTINGAPYRVVRAGFPRELTRAELHQLQLFIEEVASVQQPVIASTVPTAAAPIADEAPRISMRTADECSNYYLAVAPYAGRNNALFRAALMMRDTGWTYGDTLVVLQPLHVMLARPDERPAQREREAEATIRSVYSRAPRPPHQATRGLPNSLREALLCRNQVPLLRVLEALLMDNVPTGALLTEKEIVERLSGRVGRYSILQALQATINGSAVFAPQTPFPTPHTPTNVATHVDQVDRKKCFQLGVTASDKNRGRPPRRFQMPSIEGLCQLLGVRWTRSDALQAEDLKSPANYRRALHREFIKRRPGTYHVKLLARRLNVVDRTIQRYNHVCGVSVVPTFERYLIDMGIMHLIAAPRAGMFIEDARGKRYPCLPEVAKRLLWRGKSPRLCIQGFNHYTHPDGRYLPPGLAVKPNPTAQDPHSVFYVAPVVPQAATATKTPQIAPQSVYTPSHPAPNTPQHPSITPRSFRRVLPDAGLEAAASRLYHHVRDLVAQAHGRGGAPLSMANARRLAVQYGAELLTRCQLTLHRRKNIYNYAGFVVSFLRSEATVQRLRAACV
ncbi:MAG: bifunctional DNA primase/polymerase [Aggregatilineales bacterium]